MTDQQTMTTPDEHRLAALVFDYLAGDPAIDPDLIYSTAKLVETQES